MRQLAMLSCSTEGPSECARDHIAKSISERLSQCLVEQLWAPDAQALLDHNAKLVVQGRLCRPGSLDESPILRVIDLVMLFHDETPHAYTHVD